MCSNLSVFASQKDSVDALPGRLACSGTEQSGGKVVKGDTVGNVQQSQYRYCVLEEAA